MSIRDDAYARAGGKCECTMKSCSHHTGRCSAMLKGEWEVHRITAGPPPLVRRPHVGQIILRIYYRLVYF